MKVCEEQYKDQMSKTATLPPAYERILTFRMCSQLSTTHQPESRVILRCVSEWLIHPLVAVLPQCCFVT